MREFVAVNDSLILFDLPSLKREALMFDRVALPLYSSISEQFLQAGAKYAEVVSEIEWLMEKGVVFEPEFIEDERVKSNEEFRTFGEAAVKYSKDLDEIEQNVDVRLVTIDAKSLKLTLTPDAMKILEKQVEIFGLNARYFSLQLKVLDKLDAHPVLSAPIPSADPTSADRSEVARVVLKVLPVPDASTSWEQILEYRSDPDSRSKFLSLRNWMGEVARAELTPAEVEEKLEYLIDQYRRHMELHRMKTNAGTLETIVTTGAEVMGDLVSFKWGKAAEALFSLKRRQVALLEDELSAPGNEVAYIVKATETFS